MYIQRVKLSNFLAHPKLEVTFSPSTTVILGPNGSGKTSVIDAVVYALSGSTTRPITKKQLGFMGNKFRIQLETDQFSIIRTDKDAKLVSGDKTIEGIENVQSYINDVIPKRAINLCVIKQGELLWPLNLPPFARKQLINEILNLDALDGYRKEIQRVAQNVKRLKIDKVQKIVEEMERYYHDLKEELRQAENEISKTRALLEELEKKIKADEAHYYRKQVLQLEMESLQNDINLIKGKLVPTAKQELQSRKEELSKYVILADIADHIPTLKELYSILKPFGTVANLQRYVDRMTKVLEDAERIGDWRSKIEQLVQKQISEFKDNYNNRNWWFYWALNYAELEIDKTIVNLLREKGTTKELISKDLLEKYKDALNLLISFGYRTAAGLEKDLSEVGALYEEAKSKGINLSTIQTELDDIEMQLQEYDNLQKQLTDLKLKLSKTRQSLSEIPTVDEADLQKRKDEINQLRDKIQKLQTRIMILKQQEQLCSEVLNQYKNVKPVIPKLLETKILSNILNQLSPLLRKYMLQTLDSYFRESVRYFGFKTLDELEWNFEDLSYKSKPLSGGQLTCLAIALRLALLQFLGLEVFPFLILDEPTEYLDTERVKALSNLLSDLATQTQIIIVTHNHELASIADAVIEL